MCMLRFFAVSRLARNPNLYFEIGSRQYHYARSKDEIIGPDGGPGLVTSNAYKLFIPLALGDVLRVNPIYIFTNGILLRIQLQVGAQRLKRILMVAE